MGEHSTVVGGSSCGRLIACPASKRLSAQAPPQPPSKFTDEGSMLHSAIEHILIEGANPFDYIGYVDPEYPDHELTEDLIYEMILPALDAFAAIASEYGAFDFETETPVHLSCIDGAFGTADVIAGNDDYSFIIDWKFGRGVPVSAYKSKQLMFYARGAMDTPSVADLVPGDKPIVLCIIQPAMGTPLSTYICDPQEIADFTEALVEAHELSQTDAAPFEVGEHCRFCPAMAICPEQRKGVDLGLTLVNDTPTIDELPELLDLIDQLQPWIKAVEKAAMQSLEQGETVRGWKLVPKRATRKWVDEAKAAKALGKTVPTDDLYSKSMLSPAQAEKVLKRHGVSKDVMADHVVSISTGTTMAREDDPRPAVTPGAGVDLALPASK